jgi:hypothetical protein
VSAYAERSCGEIESGAPAIAQPAKGKELAFLHTGLDLGLDSMSYLSMASRAEFHITMYRTRSVAQCVGGVVGLHISTLRPQYAYRSQRRRLNTCYSYNAHH